MPPNSLRLARNFISKQRGELAPLPISEEELNPELQDDLSFYATPLEAMTSCYPVNYVYPQDSSFSCFDFFEDGRQRTVQIGSIPANYGKNIVIIPVHYFIVAAVILQRDNRRLKLWGQPEIQEGILVEKSLVPDQPTLRSFEEDGLKVIDTSALGGDYYALRRRALQESKKRRLAAEDKLIARWRNSSDGDGRFLIVDGTLMNLRDERNVEKCVGVSKSFGTRYFELPQHNMIMQMKQFERSWAFRFHSPDDPNDDLRQGARERISWYLRLRKDKNTEPEYGLIRVEIAKKYIDQIPLMVEEFSHSLISERFPTSYPYPRWDKHLYPIRECENYLASIMPSIETINSTMKG